MSNSLPPAPVRDLAPFEVIRRLGAGGMAEVFLAKKRGAEGTYKVLVVKRILPTYGSSRRFRSMFVEEAQLATRLNHPNVVQVYEFYDGGDDGQLLAMEYVEGPDLGKLIASAKAKGTRIGPWVSAWIIAEAAKGLHYAHERKDEGGAPLEIVHRDVSPQNVLLSFEGAVKIADFGIASAKLVVEEQGVIKGKFGYMSPEQARGEKVDKRSDLYSLGVILWETLTGCPIHGGLGGEALLDIVRSGQVDAPSTHVADIPKELENIAMRALSPRPEGRFASGREMAGAIGRALLAKQELVDAATLEATIANLVGRENNESGRSGPAPRSAPPPSEGGDHRTQAAVPMALGSLDAAARSGVPAARPHEARFPSPLTPVEERALLPVEDEGPREVRHVGLVALRLHGIDAGDAHEGGQASRAFDRLRTMLSDIAYKHGARWIWQSDIEATAIVGLGANPSRAAADACWLALDTHEAIAGIKDDLALDLGASIAIVRGIAAGSRDGDGHLVRFSLHDPATFLADTLARATPRSRTWVAGGVYRIVRREFGWGDAPSLAVKPPPGTLLPGTMRVYALERSLSREERSLGSASAPSDLVGRDIEKAELHAAYHRAVSGRGGEGEAMFRAVIGEQGIGKTVLVATFATELPPNARLVRVECSPVRAELPLYAVTELVRDILGTTGEEPFEEVCTIIARAGGGAAQGDSTSPMVARLAELVTNRPLAGGNREDAATRRRWIAAGLRNLFAAIALQQPLVVVIEGLQWADKASLDLFLDTMRPPDPLPILLVVVTRPDDRVAPLLDGLVRIELRGLSTEEQVRLVEARLGVREGVRQVCADLMPKVAGNPFFLLEMVDALLERGTLEIREATHEEGGGFLTPGETRYALVRTDRTDSPGAALPETLEQLVGDRLAELPAEERALVGWLAVAGGPLGPPELSALGGVALGEAAIRLCARGLCDRKGDVIDFRHPLTRDVAYAALGSLDREKAHLELGEHWAKTSLARGQSAAIVARHLALGGNGDRAADFYLEAARAARASYQTQLAVRYYTRAVNLLPPGDARTFAAHEALEATYRVIGRRRERIRHLQALRRVARKVATPRATVIALLRTARFDLDEGRPARGLPVARKAAELARWAALPAFEVEAEELASLLLRELGDVEGALHACDRALFACDPKATSSLPSRVRADVLHSRGILLRWVGRVKEAIASFVEAIAVFRRTGARRQEAETKSSLGHAMFASGRYEDAVALSLESIQIEISIGGRFQIAKTLATIGLAYARLGDLPRAQAYMARARDSHERYGDQDGRAETFLVSAQIMIEEEDYDQADSFVRDAAALNAVAEGTYIATQVAIVRSSLARVRGDAQIALEQAILARQLAERVTLVDSHLYAIALEASARIDLGDVHAATLAASTALGAVEALEGCEHGLEIRALSTSALACAGSKEAPLARRRAAAYAVSLLSTIRDPRLRRSFAHRRLVQSLFDTSALRSAPPGDKPDGDARIASGGGGGA